MTNLNHNTNGFNFNVPEEVLRKHGQYVAAYVHYNDNGDTYVFIISGSRIGQDGLPALTELLSNDSIKIELYNWDYSEVLKSVEFKEEDITESSYEHIKYIINNWDYEEGTIHFSEDEYSDDYILPIDEVHYISNPNSRDNYSSYVLDYTVEDVEYEINNDTCVIGDAVVETKDGYSFPICDKSSYEGLYVIKHTRHDGLYLYPFIGVYKQPFRKYQYNEWVEGNGIQMIARDGQLWVRGADNVIHLPYARYSNKEAYAKFCENDFEYIKNHTLKECIVYLEEIVLNRGYVDRSYLIINNCFGI